MRYAMSAAFMPIRTRKGFRMTDNEQGFTFRTHDHKWHPTDHEGLTLIRRPSEAAPKLPRPSEGPKPGWSSAAKRRRFARR